MDKLFKTEITNSLVKTKYQSDEEEAEHINIALNIFNVKIIKKMIQKSKEQKKKIPNK